MAVDAINKMNTICAISTPYGSGGIAVVRVSGANAITIVDSLFHAKKSLNEATDVLSIRMNYSTKCW